MPQKPKRAKPKPTPKPTLKPKPKQPPLVCVIGGGLAGMTAAKVLVENGLRVTIIEGANQLGGKASSILQNKEWQDHGFHCFPGWYRNTRALMRELHADDNLVDVHQFHFLRKGEYPRFVTTHEFSSFENILHNLFNGVLPWPENLLSYYCLLELACEPLSSEAYLDQVSGTGFLRSRFYANEAIAKLQQQTILQAAAIPAFECSALTLQHMFRAWLKWPSPLYSVLNGSLQKKLIEPLESHLRRRQVEIILGEPIDTFEVLEGRVVAQGRGDPANVTAISYIGPSPDYVVQATPRETFIKFFWASLEQQYLEFAGRHPMPPDPRVLQSMPMSAIHFRLRRALPDLPKEHVNLVDSRFGMTMVDISRFWKGVDKPFINVVSTQLAPSVHLDEVLVEAALQELLEYFPTLQRSDITDVFAQTHLNQPLFINTVGSWKNRPDPPTEFENLFVAGDYCRTEADLATMEGAVISGINAAAAVLKKAGKPARVAPLQIGAPSLPLLQLAKYAALPLIAPFGLWQGLRAQLQSWVGPQTKD